MNDQSPGGASLETIRRAATLPDHYLIAKEDADIVAHLLGGQNFSYTFKDDGAPITWGAFGKSFQTLGELRRLALDHVLDDMRLYKSRAEQVSLRRAAEIAVRAHRRQRLGNGNPAPAHAGRRLHRKGPRQRTRVADQIS